MERKSQRGKRTSGSDPPQLNLEVGDLVRIRGDTTLDGKLGCVLEQREQVPSSGPDYYLILVDNRKVLYHREEILLEKKYKDLV